MGRRHALGGLAALAALLLRAQDFAAPATEPQGRRGLLGAALLGLSISDPAHAIFGLFEGPGLVDYTLPGVFNVSMPPNYVLKKEGPGLLAWQGERNQPVEVMTAKAKAVDFGSLAEALGANASEVGERMAQVRPSVRVNKTVEATLVEALEDPAEKGLDIYQFEFLSDFIHELKLYALVKADGKNYLCSVNLRTPALLWQDRQELFRSIMATFTPLEVQPNKTRSGDTP